MSRTEPAFDLRQTFLNSSESAGFRVDQHQERVIERLTVIADGLLAQPAAPTGSEISAATELSATRRHLYLWGPVGRGKSWLLDTFFEAVPIDAKKRVHFHSFFRGLHRSIHRNRNTERDQPDVFETVVDELLDGARLLYFDEFHVHDSGDATLLIRLLTALFQRDVVVLTSSNYAPTGLLPDEMYHHLFAPGVELIQQHMDVVSLQGGVDYRLDAPAGSRSRTGFRAGRWISPGTPEQFEASGLRPPVAGEEAALAVNGHTFTASAVRGRTVWFRFADLLEASTSVNDYLVWAAEFDVWVLEGLPRLRKTSRASRQRFVNLVDVLCDLDRELTVIADTALADIATGGDLPVDMNRTTSRLSLLRHDAS